jgi:hypothetical protein
MSVKWKLEGKGTRRKWWVVTASPGPRVYIQGNKGFDTVTTVTGMAV